MGWLPGWSYRVKISIDHNDIDVPLSNFPVLMYLSTASGRGPDDVSFIFDEVGANSLKIAVTETDGTTECKVEIEKWDFGNEKAWLWVKVPSIASGADTDIYLYYDNGHADNNANVGVKQSAPGEAVWDGDFKAVYHLDEAAPPTAFDSTSNDNDLTIGNTRGVVAGLIDGEQDFEKDSFDELHRAKMNPAGDFTLECWIKLESEASDYGIFLQGRPAGGYNLEDWAIQGGTRRGPIYGALFQSSGVYAEAVIVAAPALATRYYLAFTWDASAHEVRTFLNGAFQNSDINAAVTARSNFLFGLSNPVDQPARFFDGVIDEGRMSFSERPDAYFKATYESGRDDLLLFRVPVDWTVTLVESLGLVDVISAQHGHTLFLVLSEALGLVDTLTGRVCVTFSRFRTLVVRWLHSRV